MRLEQQPRGGHGGHGGGGADDPNPVLLDIRYAVRGPLLARAAQIELDLAKGVPKPFPSVVRANIGDCHATGQKPITFLRQVQALAACPALLAGAGVGADVPADVKRRVADILDDCTAGSVGAYSPSAGLRLVRRHAAEYLSRRDQLPADEADIFLGAGASDLVRAVLHLVAHTDDGTRPGVLIPIPQYPLFSGALAELGAAAVPYLLREEARWVLEEAELERALHAAADQQVTVKALVVINPGNPTGQVMTRGCMEAAARAAARHRLLLMADEVYQENIVEKPFVSFKRLLHEMGAPYSSMPLASFLTASKGWAAECGARGGLLELLRAPRARAALVPARAVRQCPALLGQVALDAVLAPPQPGDESYPLFAAELAEIKETLRQRCQEAHRTFNDIPGYFCNPIDGAMFAFPRVEITAAARGEAARRGQSPDEFYCSLLLEDTGICVVPGSGFGQAPGSFHFRTTILHAAGEFRRMMQAFRDFHAAFRRQYGDA